jgi:hypothetical protein
MSTILPWQPHTRAHLFFMFMVGVVILWILLVLAVFIHRGITIENVASWVLPILCWFGSCDGDTDGGSSDSIANTASCECHAFKLHASC